MIKDFRNQVYKKNTESIEFLKRELLSGDIVLTHHLPSYRSVPQRYKTSPLNGFFVCDLEGLILERKPSLWVHGHTHDSLDYHLGNTRIVCNPYGYLNHELNSGWVAVKLLDI